MAPQMSHVVCERQTHDLFGQAWSVRAIWLDVDRPDTGGWLITSATDAARLTQALEAGVVYTDVHLAVDVNGASYVAHRQTVFGKYLDEDLRRLGF